MKTKLKKGYKVLAWDRTSPCRGDLQYKKSAWTYPKEGCGPLCVFRTLRDAKFWARHWGSRIYSCLYEPSHEYGVWTTDFGSYTSTIKLSQNKTLAARVKLIKLVKKL